jgi:rhodanese-related sulfurtransferase
MKIPCITAEDLKEKITRGDKFILLDVRQEAERKKEHVAGSKFIPLSSLPERCGEVDPSMEVVVYCHLGGRSAHAVEFLIQKGYKAINLEGGIMAWIESGQSTPPGD